MFYYNKGYLASSTSFCLICTSQIFKQGINKGFYLSYKIKVSLHLDDTSSRCTYPAKDTTENALLQKSTLPKDKCKFKFNILIYSQKSDLLTYFEKRRRVFHKGTVLSKWEAEVYLYFLFSLTLHLTYYLFQPFCKFCQYARYTTSNEGLFQKILFQFAWFMSKT